MKILPIFCALACIILQACTKSLTDIVKETEAATFTVYTYDEYGAPQGSGSGFFIDQTGTGITNYHVLNGAIKAIIKTNDKKEYEIEQVIASNKDWDLIRFKIKSQDNVKFPYLKISKIVPEKGEKIYNISAPLGLENSISEGIVSSFREDAQHGNTVQITAPISPGSSGSAILNKKGQYFAVATFQKSKGQNLNFGVIVNQDKLDGLQSNDFIKGNPSFNRGENFILLNLPSDKGSEITLHALEFKENMTIGYFSYTNLYMASEQYYIWCELNKKDDGFLIHDKDRDIKYYLTSSTLGIDKANGTEIPLASNTKFKVYFPPIKDKLNHIDVVYGYSSRGWKFTNIELDHYRNCISTNTTNYLKDYAYAMMHEGDLANSISIFMDILETNPEDELTLNAMGIISYVMDNNSDANAYFTKAIECNPSNTTSYLNRAQLYRNCKDFDKALNDLNKVIAIDPTQPDNYIQRAYIYADKEEWEKAISDFDKAVKSEDFKRDAQAYTFRALMKAYSGNFTEARKDIEIAYNLTNDEKLEEQLENMWKQCGGK